MTNAKSPLNLDMLNSFTGGNRTMLNDFFNIYITESEKNVEIMKKNCTDGENQDWVANAHLLKGGSGSIGATKMYDLAREAQDMQDTTSTERHRILNEIQKEFQDVKDYINEIQNG